MLKRIIKYFFLKIKWMKKVRFSFNDKISIISQFEGMNQLYPNTSFGGFMGYGSYIADYCKLVNVKIGRFCSIAPHVICDNGTHPTTTPFVTTAPCFFSLNKTKCQNGSTFATQQKFNEKKATSDGYSLEIGNDVWICENVFINGGLKIGDGAIVLSGAVVTKDVPPYSIVGGVPSRIIKYRYDNDTIQFLLTTKWWDKDIPWFKEHWELLCDIDAFKKYFSNTN